MNLIVFGNNLRSGQQGFLSSDTNVVGDAVTDAVLEIEINDQTTDDQQDQNSIVANSGQRPGQSGPTLLFVLFRDSEPPCECNAPLAK